MHLKYLDKCPVCKNSNLKPVVDLGKLYSQGSFITENSPYAPKRKLPNEIVRCDPQQYQDGCGLVFSKTIVPPEILYANYHYHSSTSQLMKNWLTYISNEATDILSKDKGLNKLSVLDIGCNDMFSLNQYPNDWLKVGIDPSDISRKAKEENPNIKLINDVFPDGMVNWSLSQGFDVVSSIACYYDTPDPVCFANAVKSLLTREGIWVFEVAYLPTMIKDLAFLQIVPEHFSHYTLAVLENILNRAGLEIFRAEKTDTNSGSLLCFASRIGNNKYNKEEWTENITNIRREEFDLELDTNLPYSNFASKIKVYLQSFGDYIYELKQDGFNIAVLGCSTKVNTLISASNTEAFFSYGIERSKEKVGGKTLWGLSIISEEEARKDIRDKLIWMIGPFHFLSEIIKREEQSILGGLQILVPLPEIQLINKDNYKEFI